MSDDWCGSVLLWLADGDSDSVSPKSDWVALSSGEVSDNCERAISAWPLRDAFTSSRARSSCNSESGMSPRNAATRAVSRGGQNSA